MAPTVIACIFVIIWMKTLKYLLCSGCVLNISWDSANKHMAIIINLCNGIKNEFNIFFKILVDLKSVITTVSTYK